MNIDSNFAWAIGLFEGEGFFGVNGTPENPVPEMKVSSTDKDVVERFCAIVGVGKVVGPKHQRGGRKPLWEWKLYRQVEMGDLILEMLPWLGKRRAAKAREILEWLASRPYGIHHREKTHCAHGHPLSGDNLHIYMRSNGAAMRICKRCRRDRRRARARA